MSFLSTISSNLFLQNNIIIAYCIIVATIFIIKFIVKAFVKLDKILVENLNDMYVNKIFITNKTIRKIKIFFKTLLRLSEFIFTSFRLVSTADELIFHNPKTVSKKLAID